MSKKSIVLLLGCFTLGGVAGYAVLEPRLGQIMATSLDRTDTLAGLESEMATFALPPILVPVSATNPVQQLRLELAIAAPPEYLKELESKAPLFTDVISQYVRSVEVSQIDDPGDIAELRTQLLRRLQTVSSPDLVREIYLTKFMIG
ncbi:flagellar basal body-associated FliL family protein [Fluviibacterium sp. DFM31]|uniref:Flagellar protein FliL n=1 Tax=Meridianimarinicoccus marinus TaxID=3231483 RepID=A0ABV3L2Z4_9RHOB